MDLTPDIEQQQILDAVDSLLEQYAGRERAIALLAEGAYDDLLETKLGEAGFLDIAVSEGTGPLEAAMVAHQVALAAGTVSYGASALVATLLLGERPAGPVAIVEAATVDAPARFGAHARTWLIDAGEEALVLEAGPEDRVVAVNGAAGYPLGKLKKEAANRAKSLGKGSGERLRSWARVALAAETAGVMKGAVDLTIAYVRDRVQFGKPIAAFQTVQHRLAEHTVTCEAARWLAYEAAYFDAPALKACTAAAYSANAALQILRECHQLHGAIGFTREYPLHVWTMRLPVLRSELGGPIAHQRGAAAIRYSAAGVAEFEKSYGL